MASEGRARRGAAGQSRTGKGREATLLSPSLHPPLIHLLGRPQVVSAGRCGWGNWRWLAQVVVTPMGTLWDRRQLIYARLAKLPGWKWVVSKVLMCNNFYIGGRDEKSQM